MKWNIGYVIVLFVSYFIGVLVGIFSGTWFNPTTEDINESSLNIPLFCLQPHERFLSILKNNLLVSIKSLVYNSLSFGLYSIIFLFYNGFVLGHIMGRCLKIFQLELILKSTLPHSFEFIGIIIYSYIGFVLSLCLLSKKITIKKLYLLLYLAIATIIIISAASIESYVSIS